jgi:hypothetical protein
MRTVCNFHMLLFIMLLSYSSCKKDGSLPIFTVKSKCLIASDTTEITGNNGYSIYGFEANTNRLMVSRKIVGNGVLLLYREIHYLNTGQPDKTVTYMNANEFYETRFFYKTGSAVPYKSELYFTDKLNSQSGKNLWGFNFYYDSKNRLNEVEFSTTKNGDHEYTLHIMYNDKDNVTRLEYEVTSGPRVPNNVITVNAFDDKPNPYSGIPYWPFLILNATWDNNDPEPIITALSKNNPLDYSIGNFKREMNYVYNENGFPLKRVNTNKNQNGQHKFNESFNYRCP